MFTIEKTGPQHSNDRLIANAVLNEADFRAIARRLDAKPMQARKTTPIAARQATAGERIETHWNGSETINTAKPGDWIATTLTADGQVLRDDDGHANQLRHLGRRLPDALCAGRRRATSSADSTRRAARSMPCTCPAGSISSRPGVSDRPLPTAT